MGLYSREDYDRDMKQSEDVRLKATRALLNGRIDSWKKMQVDRQIDELQAAYKRQLASTRLILGDVDAARKAIRECKNKGHKPQCGSTFCPCKCHKE
jgi:ATP/maltotriose-dependent transcriptional regulator MalT